jgi:hypothetical protein
MTTRKQCSFVHLRMVQLTRIVFDSVLQESGIVITMAWTRYCRVRQHAMAGVVTRDVRPLVHVSISTLNVAPGGCIKLRSSRKPSWPPCETYGKKWFAAMGNTAAAVELRRVYERDTVSLCVQCTPRGLESRKAARSNPGLGGRTGGEFRTARSCVVAGQPIATLAHRRAYDGCRRASGRQWRSAEADAWWLGYLAHEGAAALMNGVERDPPPRLVRGLFTLVMTGLSPGLWDSRR